MKIAYIANIRLPTEKAHGYQIMRTCAALQAQGAEVTLVVPKRRNPLGAVDPFTYYGIAQRYSVVRLPVIDLVGVARRLIGPLGFWIESLTFARAVKKYLREHRADWVYSRDELILKMFGPVDTKLAVELHGVPRHVRRYTSVLQRAYRIIVITRAIMAELSKGGVSASKVVVAPDAVDAGFFDHLPEKTEALAKFAPEPGLQWPDNIKYAVYIGHLYPWKGVYALADASAYLPNNWRVVTVGGVPEDIKKLRQYLYSKQLTGKVIHVSHVARNDLRLYFAIADVLVLPNSAKTDRSRLYTSPLKLFEYMAAGRPIVASDLPSIREIVSEKEVIFAKPDDPKDLARAICEAGEHDQSARVAAAIELAKQYTWEGRAKIILDALRGALPKT